MWDAVVTSLALRNIATSYSSLVTRHSSMALCKASRLKGTKYDCSYWSSGR